MFSHLLVLGLFVVVVVAASVLAAIVFRDLARRTARREIRRYLDEHPPLPELGNGGDR